MRLHDRVERLESRDTRVTWVVAEPGETADDASTRHGGNPTVVIWTGVPRGGPTCALEAAR